MRANLLLVPAIALAACLFLAPVVRAQVGDCPQSNCVESETSLVFNPQTNMMDAFTTATADYMTSYWYDLCVDLAVGRLNGPYLANGTILLPSGNPWCAPGAAQVARSGSVAAAPGRQYYAVGLAQLHVYFQYYIMVPYPSCAPYCEGYWYDALGYSQLIPTQPSNADWPSIVYTYPYVLVPVPVYYVQITMSGSADAAWSPPVIYAVTPNQWPAGATTTFTISGAGFGYDPDLTISGAGILNYTPKCLSAPSPSCDTQIVATVTIDANTPGGMTLTITVTANGLNPSGFQPVPIAGQTGQATAQATTQAFVPPVPQIWFNGVNVTNNNPPTCPGNVACVFIGQKIALTTVISLPAGVTVQSYSWSMPQGVVVGGYTPSTASGTVQPFPIAQSGTCQTLTESCLTFYWVDLAPSRTLTFRYRLSTEQERSATATFNVVGPTGAVITTTTDTVRIVQSNIVGRGAIMGMGPNRNPVGARFRASANLPPGNQGHLSWVHLLRTYNVHIAGGPQGRYACPLQGSPSLDVVYPFPSYQTESIPNDTAEDSPFVDLDLLMPGYILGEVAASFQATMYLLWQPGSGTGCSGPACTIPVPLAKVDWWWTGDSVNTLQGQTNGTTWVFVGGCEACSPNPAGSATIAHPEWTARFSHSEGLLCSPIP